MVIQITPESATAWQLKTTVSKVAKPSSRTQQILIESFDLGTTFNSQYLAVGVIVPESRDSWQYGGRISQEFNFFNNKSGYSKPKKAFHLSQELLIDKVTFVKFPPITQKEYRINYLPPRYFESVTIQIWEYTGETIDEQLQRLIDGLENNAVLSVDFSELQSTLDLLKADIEKIVVANSKQLPYPIALGTEMSNYADIENSYLPGYH